MAHSRNRLTGVVERFYERDRNGVVHKVPHRPVTADVEDRVEVFRFHIREFDRLRQRRLRRLVLLEPSHGGRLALRKITLRIDRGLPAFRRSERQSYARVPEYEVGSGELLQPEAGLATGLAQLIM